MMSRLLACLFVSLALPLTGCFDLSQFRKGVSAVSSKSKPYEEWVGDPLALSTVKSVAVIPFAATDNVQGFDSNAFCTRLANQLTSKGRLRVVYPNEFMALIKRENRRIARHNNQFRRRQLLGISIAEEREGQLELAQGRNEESVAGLEDRVLPEIDPARNINDAVTLGRTLKVDAVIMGKVTDFDPYMRPRMSLSITVISTGINDAAAKALYELTQWGVPRTASTAFGRVWVRQQNFDTRDGNVGAGVQVHGLRHHTDHDPYDAQTYIRSTDHYYDYVSTVLVGGFLDARSQSIQKAEERALAEASDRDMKQSWVRERIRMLVDPDQALPDPDRVIAENLGDRRVKNWRPDVYNRQHPNKEKALHPAYLPETNPRPVNR